MGYQRLSLEHELASLKAETTREIEDMRSALEARMRDTSHSAGLRILRQVLARMVKGEIGLRLEIFRTAAMSRIQPPHNA